MVQTSESVRAVARQWAFAVVQVGLCVAAVVLAVHGHAYWAIAVMAVVVGSCVLPDLGDDALTRCFRVGKGALALGLASAAFLDAPHFVDVLLVCLLAVCLVEASVQGWLRRRQVSEGEPG